MLSFGKELTVMPLQTLNLRLNKLGYERPVVLLKTGKNIKESNE